MDSDKRNITLNFKKSIGKFRPFTSDITETDATYFNDLNLRIQKKNIENL